MTELDGKVAVSGLSKQFGSVRAVDDLTFTVAPNTSPGFSAPTAQFIGIGLGTLVRNQVAATVITLLLSLWHHQGDKIYRWFPGNAGSAVTDQFLGGGLHLLAPWAGALVLLGYGVAFAALGSALTLRRDVT